MRSMFFLNNTSYLAQAYDDIMCASDHSHIRKEGTNSVYNYIISLEILHSFNVDRTTIKSYHEGRKQFNQIM